MPRLTMNELFDLKVHINGHHIFFLNQSIVCSFSGRLRKMVKQGMGRAHEKGYIIQFIDFPGGAEAFELALKFCYNNGRIFMSPSNICLLHSAAIFLEMNEESALYNLLEQAEAFLDGLFYWTWEEILGSLRSCESFLDCADYSGLLQKLLSCLLFKISANSDILLSLPTPSQSSPSSSSSTNNSSFRCSSIQTFEFMKPCFSREWWFEDLTILAPSIIEKMTRELGCYGSDNKNLILTRFLLHYLKTAKKRNRKGYYSGIAESTIHGLMIAGKNAYSFRGLLWVLGLFSGLEIGKESRVKAEYLIGSIFDMATLDDLLVSGRDKGVYDVNLVIRLIRVFVKERSVSLPRMKKVGKLMDEYLREISPDQSLKVSTFLAAAESLPDSARDCYDGIYRALDIYLESHQNLSFEARMRLCRCINYEKLTLEACKDLAKNPRIPPGIAVQALISQKSKIHVSSNMEDEAQDEILSSVMSYSGHGSPKSFDRKEALAFNLHKMQSRVMQLENSCKEMRGQMSKMARNKYIVIPTYHSKGLPRLC